MGIIVFYISRIIVAIILGFMQKDYFDNKYEDSDYYQGKRFFIYHNLKNFLIFLIPFIGWIYFIFKEYQRKDKNIFFNN